MKKLHLGGTGLVVLATVLAFLVACTAPASAPTPPPEPTPPVEPEKLGISLSDPSSDLFNKAGISWTGFGAYVDITKSELSLSNGYYLAKIELNSPLPAKTDDPSIFIEWDILVDSDCDAGTGWNWPLICNDIGSDYLLRLELKNSQYKGSVLNIKTNKWGSIEYKIDANIVELRFSSETIGEPANFNFVVAVRKYGERGAPQALQVADKAPNEGHYVFPNHHAYVEPGLPTTPLESDHATVYYNPGNEAKAKWYAEAFEYAYTQVSTELEAYPAQRFKLYVYATQEDLVKGLQEFSGFSPEAAAFFKSGGAPRPINYIMHVCPNSGWHDMAHEYTHTIIEELSGRVFLSIKWLDEGLANYIAHEAVSKTKYKENEVQWRASQTAIVRKALDEGRLFALKDTSTEVQWCPEGLGTPECHLQYAQAYVVVTYLVQTYGIDKCKAILQLMEGGLSQEVAVQEALGISLAQFEADFRNYLQT